MDKKPATQIYDVLKQLPLRKGTNGEPWQAGETIELTPRAAQYLLLSGHLAEVTKPKAKKAASEAENRD